MIRDILIFAIYETARANNACTPFFINSMPGVNQIESSIG